MVALTSRFILLAALVATSTLAPFLPVVDAAVIAVRHSQEPSLASTVDTGPVAPGRDRTMLIPQLPKSAGRSAPKREEGKKHPQKGKGKHHHRSVAEVEVRDPNHHHHHHHHHDRREEQVQATLAMFKRHEEHHSHHHHGHHHHDRELESKREARVYTTLEEGFTLDKGNTWDPLDPLIQVGGVQLGDGRDGSFSDTHHLLGPFKRSPYHHHDHNDHHHDKVVVTGSNDDVHVEKRDDGDSNPGVPGTVDIVTADGQIRVASLILSTVNNSTTNGTSMGDLSKATTTSNGSFVLDATKSAGTSFFLVPVNETTMIRNSTTKTTSQPDGQIPVSLRVNVFSVDQAVMVPFCATYDSTAQTPAPLTMANCSNSNDTSSQVFGYTPSTGVIQPFWQQQPVNVTSNATNSTSNHLSALAAFVKALPIKDDVNDVNTTQGTNSTSTGTGTGASSATPVAQKVVLSFNPLVAAVQDTANPATFKPLSSFDPDSDASLGGSDASTFSSSSDADAMTASSTVATSTDTMDSSVATSTSTDNSDASATTSDTDSPQETESSTDTTDTVSATATTSLDTATMDTSSSSSAAPTSTSMTDASAMEMFEQQPPSRFMRRL